MKYLDIKELFSIYGISNTPSFLFDKFRNSNSVKHIAFFNSEKQLIKMINNLMDKDELNHENIIKLYALLIALTLKNTYSVYNYFSNLSENKNDWINFIKDFYLVNYQESNSYSIDLKFTTKPLINTKSNQILTDKIVISKPKENNND